MAMQYPRRRLDDWSPDLGELDEWLAEQAQLGWEPEYGGTGTDVVVNGQLVRRFAMIMRSPPEDG